jgi:hypothetical protein
MEYPFNQSTWKEILTVLYHRAAADHQFHVLCQRDPHAAIKLVCGKEVPSDVTLRFEPQQSEEILLILPPENKELFKPLSDKDLESFATAMATITSLLFQTHQQPKV